MSCGQAAGRRGTPRAALRRRSAPRSAAAQRGPALARRASSRVEDPLAGGAPQLIARDRSSLLLTAYFSSNDVQVLANAADEASERLSSSRFHGHRRRPGRRLQRSQRHGPLGPAPGRADRLPAARPAAADRLPRRRRGVDPAAGRDGLGRRDLPRPAGDVGVRRYLGLRAQHHHGDRAGAGRRLRAAAGHPLPRGARARRAEPRVAPPPGRVRRPHGRLLGPDGSSRDGGADAPAAALPLLARRGRRDRRLFAAFGALLVVPSLLALLGPRVNALSLRRGRRSPTSRMAGTGWPAA